MATLWLRHCRSIPCPRWHQDKVPLRLIVAYHGRGTQWVDDIDAIHVAPLQARLRAAFRMTDQVPLQTAQSMAPSAWPHIDAHGAQSGISAARQHDRREKRR